MGVAEDELVSDVVLVEDPDPLEVIDDEPVTLGLCDGDMTEGVVVAVTVAGGDADTDVDMVDVIALVAELDPVPAGVVDTAGVVEGVMQPGKGADTAAGAIVTPRNSVLIGAVAITVLTLVAVLYEYSVVGDVRYRTYAEKHSNRPAMLAMSVPASIKMGTRDHTPFVFE